MWYRGKLFHISGPGFSRQNAGEGLPVTFGREEVTGTYAYRSNSNTCSNTVVLAVLLLILHQV